jgi:Fanconi anemia group M protein
MQKILPSDKIRIIVDTRERRIAEHLSRYDAKLIHQQLKVGDFVCSDRVGIERKTISDFLQSIIDQRIFNQASELVESYERPVLILEGNPEALFSTRNIHENAIRSVMGAIAIDFKLPIIWTIDDQETAAQIYRIAHREQVKEKRELLVRVKKRCPTFASEQEFIVSGLPTVSNKLSRRLLKKFKTPKKVFSASESALQKVEGIGKEKAKKIWDMLNKEYEKCD